MKNILFLLTAILLTSVEITAQSVPAGMRYQAIARGLDGSLLPAKSLIVQVELFSAGAQEKVFYNEMHNVRSSELGLLDFVIGEGSQPTGKFSAIPWMSEEMWVRISVKAEGDKHYQIISSGQLYSVPYALYAGTAGEIKEEIGGNRAVGIGMNSINWTLEGNYNSQYRNDGRPVLGTTDANDLVFVTNNIPRMIIDKNGMINFMVDVAFGGDLNVDGTTTLNGSLTVTNEAATHLTGTLTVDGATTLNDVVVIQNMAPVALTGSLDVDKTLNVDGTTTLNSSLAVTGMSASSLSGTLTVDKTSALNGLTVANTSSTDLTGSLDVDQAMNVDEATTLNSTLDVTGSSATLSGILSVTNTTTLNGALTVENAAPTHLTGSLTVDGAVLVDGEITVDGPLVVSGENPTHLTGTLEVDKLATLEGGLSVSGGSEVGPDGSHLALFDNVEGGTSDGIAIQIDNNQLNKENNFMTFYRGNGTTIAGRIESYQIEDITDIPAPTGEEIWAAICFSIADYNPITIAWTQMASAYNLVAEGWNATTIPAFDIPDIPAFVIPDVPALAIPDVPAFVIPDVPGFVIPDIPGVVIPDIPELVIGPYLCVDIEVCACPCDILDPFNFDCCCIDEEVCVIPEFTLFPGITIPDFPGIAIPDFPGIPIPDFPGIPIPDFPGIAIPDFPGLVIPAVPELNLSDVFGTAPTIPTFSDILVEQGVCPDIDIFDIEDGYFKRLAVWAFENRLHNLVTIDPIMLVGNALSWGLTSAVLDNGVVYGSKGADYAEYLPKMYETEQFLKGEIVGVHSGRISKNTEGADQILAITSQPLVLGNMQDADVIADFEKVAFLGQIPVYVKGPVALGDFIIPSGNNDGVAIAIPSQSLTTEMLAQVLGKAWSAYEGNGVTLINTSIGLNPVEISDVLKKQAKMEDTMKAQMEMQRDNTEVLSNEIDRIKHALGLTASVNNP